MQAVSIKPRVVSALWFQRLKLQYHELRSTFAFNFNLRRYVTGVIADVDGITEELHRAGGAAAQQCIHSTLTMPPAKEGEVATGHSR